LAHAITCAGRDCSVQVARKAEFRWWKKSHPYSYWAPRWCLLCAERRERAEEVERGRLAEDERRKAVREARRREVADLEECAAGASGPAAGR
jgi:hypothetical protein